MAERVSALAGHTRSGRFGAEGEPGVTLSDVGGLKLHQVAAWPDTLSAVGQKAAKAAAKTAEPAAIGQVERNVGHGSGISFNS